jgi:hypothetical protein
MFREVALQGEHTDGHRTSILAIEHTLLQQALEPLLIDASLLKDAVEGAHRDFAPPRHDDRATGAVLELDVAASLVAYRESECTEHANDLTIRVKSRHSSGEVRPCVRASQAT